jgi:hypothetical protein
MNKEKLQEMFNLILPRKESYDYMMEDYHTGFNDCRTEITEKFNSYLKTLE